MSGVTGESDRGVGRVVGEDDHPAGQHFVVEVAGLFRSGDTEFGDVSDAERAFADLFQVNE